MKTRGIVGSIAKVKRVGDLRLGCLNIGRVICERIPAIRNLFQHPRKRIFEINRSVETYGHG
jgi:hypothetical protein